MTARKKGGLPMLVPTIVMAVLAVALLVVGIHRGQGQHILGLQIAWRTGIAVVPLLVVAFVVAGMVQALVPPSLISRWVGQESGWRGIALACLAGGFAPGGPYVSLPLALALLKSGASLGVMVSFLTAWSLWAFARLPMEFGILGARLTFIRLAATAVFPPLAGILANVIQAVVLKGR